MGQQEKVVLVMTVRHLSLLSEPGLVAILWCLELKWTAVLRFVF